MTFGRNEAPCASKIIVLCTLDSRLQTCAAAIHSHFVKILAMPPTPKKETSAEEAVGIVPSHGISIDLPSTEEGKRPSNIRHVYYD